MRCAVLIIGSLWWDDKNERPSWRSARLKMDEAQIVTSCIRYGRTSTSRGNTHTMVLDNTAEPGNALLVPCIAPANVIGDLITEARALWKAEASKAAKDSISAKSGWGCVGATFRDGDGAMKQQWSDYYALAKETPIAPTDSKGQLAIGWPRTLDGADADFDAILATTNTADDPIPNAKAVAKAWSDQCGDEDYFFNNVRDGIRTADDLKIWAEIENASPSFLEKNQQLYGKAIEILREEAIRSIGR